MRHRKLLAACILVLCLSASGQKPVALELAAGAPIPAARLSKPSPEPRVTVQAASGATIRFVTQNGQPRDGLQPLELDLPHLTLHRNGSLTPPQERTLVIAVRDLMLPPTGLTITLAIETYHRDPDQDDALANRIVVWQESRRLGDAPSWARTAGAVDFEVEFGETVMSGIERVATPTGYYGCELRIFDERYSTSAPIHAFSRDLAFLMEDQLSAPLNPGQLDREPGLPQELVVYYCDMFVFQHDITDPVTRLRRGQIPGYVRRVLLPAMIGAVHTQTQEWGFPWQPAWHSHRAEDGAARLSVAFSHGDTWYHGRAPVRGHSGISLRTRDAVNRHYQTLTGGLLSTFHHELFHNIQRGMAQELGGCGDIDGQKGAWAFFSEGTAVLAETVAQPAVHFAPASASRSYLSLANGFLGETHYGGEMNTSYTQMIPYYAAVYWRFLYEKCGGMADGTEDPAAGLRIVRRSLETLYSRSPVDINQSIDLIHGLPAVMDQALNSPEASLCPFSTFRESLQHMARDIYRLRLVGGRCTEPGWPAGCGFYDPEGLYLEPPVTSLDYKGEPLVFEARDQPYRGGIRSSYGIDFVELGLDPAAQGQPLTLDFFGAPGASAEFGVELWMVLATGGPDGSWEFLRPVSSPGALDTGSRKGHLRYTIPEVDTGAANRLVLIITRLDSEEALDPLGAYTLVLHPDLSSEEPRLRSSR